MNKARREELIAKYHIDHPPMNPALNTTVQAILKAERIEANLADDTLLNKLLFDPTWCPTLHGKLTAALAELHAAEGQGGRVDYRTFRGETYDPHDPKDTSGTVLLKWPHDCRIFVCRNQPDRMAAMLQSTGLWNTCDVQIADDCTSLCFVDYPTRPLPISCGRVVLMFEICAACEFTVSDTVFFNMRSGVMEAQAKLPPGAVVDPGSPVPSPPF